MVDDKHLAEEYLRVTSNRWNIGFIIFFNNGVLDKNETVEVNNVNDPSGVVYN